MFTVVETHLFQKQWPHYWSEEERGEFAAYITGSKLKEIRRVIEN